MTIAIELDESTYQHLAETARAHNLTPAELVKNLAIAYEESQRDQSKQRISIRDIPRLSLSGMLKPVGTVGEIFEEMVDLRNE
jgi:hypothetical protein